jgi:hypothetical protein
MLTEDTPKKKQAGPNNNNGIVKGGPGGAIQSRYLHENAEAQR